MTDRHIARADSAAALRQAFDRSFAEPPSVDAAALHDLLDLRVGSARYALPVTDLSALMADTKITPIATPVPALLGITALRGTMLPVYDLGAVLGVAPEPAPRWIAVAAGRTPVGLAFARFEGHLRVRADSIVSEVRSGSPHVQQVVRLDGGHSLALVSVASVLDAIADRVRAAHINE